MMELKPIASFQVDHTKLTEGMYISRVDGDVVTYDIRMVRPNCGTYLGYGAIHSFEHLFATYVRSGPLSGQVIYAGTCRGLTPAEIAERSKTRAPAWRVQVPDEVIAFEDGHMGHYEENLARDCGDFFLRRADGVFAYQLAVVVDDALMGVDEVVRGSDLLSSTPRQLWLYRELGLTPPKFYHLPLLLASDGRRLSKRDGDQSLENLREKYTPEEIIGKLAFACGLQASPAPTTPQALARTFDWSQVPKSDIVLPENLF